MDKASVTRLREEWGFVITDDRDPDLLGWLFNLFLEHLDAENAAAAAAKPAEAAGIRAEAGADPGPGWVKDFVEFARARLRENPPMTMTYLPRGIAVQLQNYQQLVLVEPAEDAPDTGDTRAKGAVGITTANRGGGGIPGFQQRDAAVQVTGTGARKK